MLRSPLSLFAKICSHITEQKESAYGALKASFEAKRSDEDLARRRRGRRVIGIRERRIGQRGDRTHTTAGHHTVTLGEEELSDVNLGTFYVLDQENVSFGERVQLARRGCGGCGCRGCAARGCRGCGCGGCRGCGGVRFFGGCGGCGCGCTTGCRIWTGWAWVWVC